MLKLLWFTVQSTVVTWNRVSGFNSSTAEQLDLKTQLGELSDSEA